MERGHVDIILYVITAILYSIVIVLQAKQGVTWSYFRLEFVTILLAIMQSFGLTVVY